MALVGLDRTPCAKAPKLAAGLLPLLQSLLGVMALALDHAVLLRQAEALSVTDDLTGLHNSRYLRDALHREAKRAVRYGRPLVGAVRRSGRVQAGERHARPPVRQPDAGGGRARSFAAARARATWWPATAATSSWSCCPTRRATGAVVVARRVRDRLAAFRFLQALHLDVRLTASVGIASLPDVTLVPEDLLRAADEAMYRVKERGKNDVILATRA